MNYKKSTTELTTKMFTIDYKEFEESRIIHFSEKDMPKETIKKLSSLKYDIDWDAMKIEKDDTSNYDDLMFYSKYTDNDEEIDRLLKSIDEDIERNSK